MYPRRLNAQEVLTTQKDGEFVFLAADGSAKLSGRDYEFQEPTLRREFTVRRENLSGESHGDREEFQPEETKDDAENPQWLLVYSRRLHLSSSYRTESSIRRAMRRIIPCSTEIHWCHQVNSYRFGRCTRNTNWWQLECRRRQKSVRFVDGFHKIYIIERNSSKRIFVFRAETDKNPNDITSRSHVAWRSDKNWKSRSKKRKTRMGNRETAMVCRRLCSRTSLRETVVPKQQEPTCLK